MSSLPHSCFLIRIPAQSSYTVHVPCSRPKPLYGKLVPVPSSTTNNPTLKRECSPQSQPEACGSVGSKACHESQCCIGHKESTDVKCVPLSPRLCPSRGTGWNKKIHGHLDYTRGLRMHCVHFPFQLSPNSPSSTLPASPPHSLLSYSLPTLPFPFYRAYPDAPHPTMPLLLVSNLYTGPGAWLTSHPLTRRPCHFYRIALCQGLFGAKVRKRSGSALWAPGEGV